MLRTTIQTTDESTGKEIPVPADLLAKVRRASDILADVLRKVASKIDISVRWSFAPRVAAETITLLSFSVENGGFANPFAFTAEDLRDAESVRGHLCTPIKQLLLPQLDEVVDRQFEGVRRGFEALAAVED